MTLTGTTIITETGITSIEEGATGPRPAPVALTTALAKLAVGVGQSGQLYAKPLASGPVPAVDTTAKVVATAVLQAPIPTRARKLQRDPAKPAPVALT